MPDIFVGVMWARLGTPTGRAASGTVEEFNRALTASRLGAQIEFLFYFNEAPYTPSESSIGQAAQVLAFRKHLEQTGFFVGTYRGAKEFEAKARADLTQVIRRRARSLDEVARVPVRTAERSQLPRPMSPDSAFDTQLWESKLLDGELRLEIAGGFGREAHALIATVARVMEQRDFRPDTRKRVEVCFTELVNNVAEHAGGQASMRIEIHTDQVRSVVLSCADDGPGFGLPGELRRHMAFVKSGGREHGLLLVSRLAGSLARIDRDEVHETKCEIHEWPVPDSELFRRRDVAPIRVDLEGPSYGIWIGPHFYAAAIFRYLKAPSMAELYFKSLDVRGKSLGIEFLGDIWVSTVREGGDLPPEAVAMRAIARHFAGRFSRKDIIVDVSQADWRLSEEVEEWIDRWDQYRPAKPEPAPPAKGLVREYLERLRSALGFD